VTLLHRRHDGQAAFGPRLRCSGCHVNGGLIQKELAPPHNDWFVQNRQLQPGTLKPEPFVQGRLKAVLDADELSKQVKASAQRLADSANYQKVLAARTMQEQLRPLFCPMELNIESDSQPVDDNKPALRVPAAFFVDPRLATADISIDREHYDAAVRKLNSSLPQTPGRADADHGWLTPVKANSDSVAAETLIARGIVSREFAIAVLAVDFTNPVFSKVRCDLLKLVPDQPGPDFVTRFQGALRGSGGTAPIELLNNLSDPSRNAAFHQKQATEFMQACQKRAADPEVVLGWYRLLAQRRAEVSESEISKNRKGHILEDRADGRGRVVFPSTDPRPMPGGWRSRSTARSSSQYRSELDAPSFYRRGGGYLASSVANSCGVRVSDSATAFSFTCAAEPDSGIAMTLPLRIAQASATAAAEQPCAAPMAASVGSRSTPLSDPPSGV
jgi:hypothetical protein